MSLTVNPQAVTILPEPIQEWLYCRRFVSAVSAAGYFAEHKRIAGAVSDLRKPRCGAIRKQAGVAIRAACLDPDGILPK